MSSEITPPTGRTTRYGVVVISTSRSPVKAFAWRIPSLTARSQPWKAYRCGSTAVLLVPPRRHLARTSAASSSHHASRCVPTSQEDGRSGAAPHGPAVVAANPAKRAPAPAPARPPAGPMHLARRCCCWARAGCTRSQPTPPHVRRAQEDAAAPHGHTAPTDDDSRLPRPCSTASTRSGRCHAGSVASAPPAPRNAVRGGKLPQGLRRPCPPISARGQGDTPLLPSSRAARASGGLLRRRRGEDGCQGRGGGRHVVVVRAARTGATRAIGFFFLCESAMRNRYVTQEECTSSFIYISKQGSNN